MALFRTLKDRRPKARLILCAVALVLAGCIEDPNNPRPLETAEAWRFLTQATFGPTDTAVEHLVDVGFDAWIEEQWALQPEMSYQDFVAKREAELKAVDPSAQARQEQVVEAVYTRAVTDASQLRQRVLLALSEIFVISLQDARIGDHPQMAAFYLDTLNAGLDGNYRQLLEAITKTPAMGQYLTYRSNQKEDPDSGRVPDENYAREVMQLFSIGLNELNLDGTVVTDSSTGQPKPTYGGPDVKGLAKVFTGWSNYRGTAYASVAENLCFWIAAECADPLGERHAMVAYPNFHSTSEKSFLGVTVGAQSTPDAQASLSAALDRLANHPNVAPFISRQLIQRLVTSNPSPAYVKRVAQTFVSTKGNFKAVVKAILIDTEARDSGSFFSPTSGKLREPMLRLTALLRAFRLTGPGLGTAAKLKNVGITTTSDPALSFGQSPLSAPSVFNFFRPGYVPPQSGMAAQGLVAPEMQLVSETSVAGYANAVLGLLEQGLGPRADEGQPSVSLALTEALPLAYKAETLANEVSRKLLGGTMSTGLRADITTAVESIPVPELDAQQSNGAQVNAALERRVKAAILITAVSPEFLVQK